MGNPYRKSKEIATHPDIAHPNQSPLKNYEKNPGFQPVGKGFFGVCSKDVLKQP